MSLILDALKKSEQSRKRSGAPGIADVPTAAPESRTPRWILPLIALLALNAIVVLFALTRNSTEPAATVDEASGRERVAATESAAADSDPVGAPDDELPPLPRRTEVRSLSREVAVGTPPASEPQPRPRETIATSPMPDRVGIAPVPAPSQPVETGSELRRYAEVRERLGLPELHIDLHVYHAEPNRRLAYINGVKLTVGETASAGYRVKNIVSDGVELEFRGTEFLLPRD